MSTPQLRPSPFLHFDLPKEHGATVAFVLAATLSMLVVPVNATAITTVVTMTALMLSLKHPVQLVILAAVASSVVTMMSGSILVAFPIFAMGLGAFALNDAGSKISFGLKQTVGMTAVAFLPLLTAIVQAGFAPHILSKSLLFVACTLLSTAMVQISAKSGAMPPKYSIAGAALLFGLATAITDLQTYMILLLIPFAVQYAWLKTANKPSFKMLGIAQTLCLMWCAALLIR